MLVSRAGPLALGLVLVSACGPRITEIRSVPTPSRPEGCQLEFVKLDMMDLLSQNGAWQLIGNVILGDSGAQDPFSDRNRAIVRPRACNMGGEAVAIIMSATSEGLVNDTSINYAILKHRSSAAEQPKTF